MGIKAVSFMPSHARAYGFHAISTLILVNRMPLLAPARRQLLIAARLPPMMLGKCAAAFRAENGRAYGTLS